MKMTIRFALLSAAFGLLSNAAFAEVDCAKLAQSVKQAVAADTATTLQVVEKEIGANPGCACEVVKAAIEGANADAKLVAAIVETAATAAPQHMRLISQCAVAVAPDALAKVQSVMAKLDPNSGEAAPKKLADSKDAKGPGTPPPPAGNPLDFPSNVWGVGTSYAAGSTFGPGTSPGMPTTMTRSRSTLVIYPPPVTALVPGA